MRAPVDPVARILGPEERRVKAEELHQSILMGLHTLGKILAKKTPTVWTLGDLVRLDAKVWEMTDQPEEDDQP